MTSHRSEAIQALLAERESTIDEIWRAAEERLDRPLSEGLNTAHEACDRWARDRSRIAIIVRHPDGRSERWTFAELSHASSRMATALTAAGLKPGDRFAALLGQGVEAFICALAAWRAGLIYMPMFVGFGPDAVAERLRSGRPEAVVVDHRYREVLEKARLLLDHDPKIYTVTGEGGRGLLVGDRSLWAEIDRHTASAGTAVTAPGDAATLMYTSGTTGAPKGCIQPHSMVLSLQPFVRHAFALLPSDLLFTGANPGWSYGLHVTGTAVMAQGRPAVIYTGDFDARAWLRVMAEERVTYAAGAPTAFRRVVQAARQVGLPTSLRGASCAGEPLDAPLAEAWHVLAGSDLQDGYGQSESAMVLANLAYDPHPAVPGALSSVVPGFYVGLVDDDGNEQQEQGIIALRSPRYQASTGYWNAPHLWDARWRGEWFLTGDLARRDEQGRWHFIGRDDDLIVTSGYNVGPTEVENIILAHPGVQEAAVVAAPDPARGNVVRAVIVPNGTDLQARIAADVRDAVKQHLGRHAAPKVIDFVDALPRTETGKIRRNVLREQHSGD
ncbi:acyl-CoA synthetase [Streptomyces thinghirensis]|uniref:AMP-binding protein n=1 Tax=Streptomyces thinghirensis TaxID=551547 RepID=A0ABP9T7Q3_9ACTN